MVHAKIKERLRLQESPVNTSSPVKASEKSELEEGMYVIILPNTWDPELFDMNDLYRITRVPAYQGNEVNNAVCNVKNVVKNRGYHENDWSTSAFRMATPLEIFTKKRLY